MQFCNCFKHFTKVLVVSILKELFFTGISLACGHADMSVSYMAKIGLLHALKDA